MLIFNPHSRRGQKRCSAAPREAAAAAARAEWCVRSVANVKSQFKILGRVLFIIWKDTKYLLLICDLLVQHTALHPCAGWPDSSPSQHTMAHPETGEELKQGWALEERESFIKNCAKKTVTVKQLWQLYLNPMLTRI